MPKVPEPKCYFGEVLNSIAKKYEVSLAQWGEGVVKQPMMSMYMRCERLPSADTLVELANKLHLSTKERKRLYRARMIAGRGEKRIWNPKIIDALPRAKELTPEELKARISQKGYTIARLAKKIDADENIIRKIVEFAPDVEILGKRRAVVSTYLERMSKTLGLSDEETAGILLALMKSAGMPEDFINTLTSDVKSEK